MQKKKKKKKKYYYLHNFPSLIVARLVLGLTYKTINFSLCVFRFLSSSLPFRFLFHYLSSDTLIHLVLRD
jgi:hypothetical protein